MSQFLWVAPVLCKHRWVLLVKLAGCHVSVFVGAGSTVYTWLGAMSTYCWVACVTFSGWHQYGEHLLALYQCLLLGGTCIFLLLRAKYVVWCGWPSQADDGFTRASLC